ncbi:MAG: A/G-specific adenine glycosylase [Deltaproteobacteria bacterium]|nr:MAG: A/G-specific adenine glycosylase [Deltaproteobacteria bacterium]
MFDPTRALLEWYDRHQRTLPWRTDPTPYHVLLSEFMLQQTRVETVIPYFERFIARWPTLSDLAGASSEDVMEAWAGLGYYRRARNLHAAAKMAVAQGGLRADPEAIRALPGVGAYTAGAIASIAFGLPEPAVDGNVDRVISRLSALREDPTKAKGKRLIREKVMELQPAERAGDFNQALMELGATLCSPRSPSCLVCPWSEGCEARALGIAESLPNKPKKKQPVPERGVSGLLWTGQGWLMGRRPPDMRLGGLWEPPSGLILAGESSSDAVIRVMRDHAGVEVEVVRSLGEVLHVFTHRRLTREVFEVRPRGVMEPCASASYDAIETVPLGDSRGMSKLARKTLALGGALTQEP